MSQQQISEERYDIISARFNKYLENLGENTEPVTVFDPLSPKLIQELELIRNVSRDLQIKKEQYIKKLAEDKEEAKKVVEEKVAVEMEVQEETKKEE